MRLAVLVLLLVMRLPASTILPGSWIEAWIGHGGSWKSMELNLQADDGFYIVGGGDAGISLHDGIVYLDWAATSSNAWVTSVSPPWKPGDGLSTAADGAFFFMSAPDTHISAGSAPFTFYGYLDSSGEPIGSPVHPLFYEFSGQGTAYFNIEGEGNLAYIHSARYEFELAETPEGSTWLLLLLGLCAAWWAGKKPR